MRLLPGRVRVKLWEWIRLNARRLDAWADRLISPAHVELSADDKRILPWHEALGDQTLRQEYSLGPDSIVFDVGGYEGQWASDIYARYLCTVYIFEPVPEFAAALRKRFRQNSRILIHEVGLSSQTGSALFSVCGDASSALREGEKAVKVSLVAASDFIGREGIQEIDLMKVNIEGGEYDLLEHLLGTGDIQKVRNLQVQFHDFVPEAEDRRQDLQKKLARTHQITYEFPWIWENWEQRK